MAEKSNDLIVASGRGDLGMVEKILETHGDKNVDIRDRHNYTPLIWAARQGHHEVVKKLIAVGADVNGQNEPPPA